MKFFTAEDFKANDVGKPGFLEMDNAHRAAAIANAKLEAQGKRVYGKDVSVPIGRLWTEKELQNDTHTALLIGIEEIGK